MVPMNRSNFKADKAMMREVMGVGGPKTVQLTISNITDLLQRVFLIIAGGTTAVMLYNFTWRYLGIAGLPGRAIETAQLPVSAAAYGQKDLDKVEEAFRYSVKLGLGVSFLMVIVLFVFAEPLMMLMTYEESMRELLPEFVWTLRVSVFLMPFLCVAGSCSSLLQCIKKAKIPMYVYMVWGVLKLGLYALASYGLLGVDPFEGIIYCMVIVHTILFIVMWTLSRHEFKKLRASSVS
jgi:Na+-driven multidrug efflux pump